MTLVTFNHYVDRVTVVNKTAPSSGKHGARHAGARVPLLLQVIRPKAKGGARHAKGRARQSKA